MNFLKFLKFSVKQIVFGSSTYYMWLAVLFAFVLV